MPELSVISDTKRRFILDEISLFRDTFFVNKVWTTKNMLISEEKEFIFH